MALLTHESHASDLDAADGRPARGGSGDGFAFFFFLLAGAPFGDVGGGGEDFLAGDGGGFVLAGREEGDVVAEARGVDDHEVGACADFLDPADAVGGLRVAVELDFDFAVTAGEIAGGAAGEGLDEVAKIPFCAELSCRGFVVGWRGGRWSVLWRVDLRFRFVVGRGALVPCKLAKDVGRGGRIFHGWEDGGAFTGWELMELLDIGVVAEAVRPPAGDEVHAVPFHLFQELPAAIGCAGDFSGFFGLVLGFDGVILRGNGYCGDLAEVWSALQYH